MLKKNLHLCFSSIKCLPTSFSQKPPTLEDDYEEEDYIYSSTHDESITTTTAATTSSSSSGDHYWASSEPDLSTVFASQRFFFSSPGPSNSILEYSPAVVDGSVAVRKYSPDPYVDFRRSMEEMVRAKMEDDQLDPTAHGYLHELLFCYLSLNPKHTHKLIVRAFTDLLFSLTSTAGDSHMVNGGDAR
ncbi:uncharacterized protein [Phyllobates terribilis]|uniref:uncharacterized protein n=1 Tax=Phyllobates terribilis TaxID=111132 RepID=UPI003CCA85A9